MTERMGVLSSDGRCLQPSPLAARAMLRPAARRLAAVGIGFAGGWAVLYGALMPFGLGLTLGLAEDCFAPCAAGAALGLLLHGLGALSLRSLCQLCALGAAVAARWLLPQKFMPAALAGCGTLTGMALCFALGSSGADLLLYSAADALLAAAIGFGLRRFAPERPGMGSLLVGAAVAAALILGIVVAAAAGLFGGKDVEVKSFKGMTVTEAENWLKDNNIDLKIKEGRKVVSEDVEAGKIVSQNPKEGEKVKEGSTITVYFSKGKGEGSVHNLTGSMESEAQATLEAAGFTLGDIKYEASEEEKGTIIRQSPEGGTNAEKGSKVTIYVSDGSQSKAIMPYLVGKTIGDAKSALSNAGLKMGSPSYDYSTTYAEGEVMWQQYDANAQLDKGTTVRVRVSKGPEPTAPSQPETPSGPDDEDD